MKSDKYLETWSFGGKFFSFCERRDTNSVVRSLLLAGDSGILGPFKNKSPYISITNFIIYENKSAATYGKQNQSIHTFTPGTIPQSLKSRTISNQMVLLETTIFFDISQAPKDKYCMFSHLVACYLTSCCC